MLFSGLIDCFNGVRIWGLDFPQNLAASMPKRDTMKTFSRTVNTFFAIIFTVILMSGCSSSENQSGASTNEIQQYIQNNPDKIARPEDSPANEQAEFEAGNN